jgi:hypothetical protein
MLYGFAVVTMQRGMLKSKKSSCCKQSTMKIHSHIIPEIADLANRIEADPTSAAELKNVIGHLRLCELLDLPPAILDIAKELDN